ncbi:MAG: aminotransferase [Planctomycetaceae bacterium]|nr:aminotransferase [Planctomycetaceae bacterium]MBP60462.1 aminotransferase [Planctomycetaceae bacterium]
MASNRIYLDNAATSWPKPDSVYEAVQRCMRDLGAPAGRCSYTEANEVERLVSATRQSLSRLLGADRSSQIVFTSNGSDALNLAIHGLLRPGDHVITSQAEHNSILRPLAYQTATNGVAVSYVGCDRHGVVSPDEVQAAIRDRTRLIALTHASNVTGAIQPAEAVGRLAREHGIVFLLDAAQTLGHQPIDVKQLQVDLLAGSGHKGLLGPLGTGLLYVGSGTEVELTSLKQGGTGSDSHSELQPESLPEKYEVGNLNVPGIIGWGAALEFLSQRGLQEIRSQLCELTARLLSGLKDIPGIQIFGPAGSEHRVPVVSLSLPGIDPQEAALMLDSAYRIQVRSGLHCAPRMHRCLETDSRGGTLRLSLGVMNTSRQVDVTVKALTEIGASAAS